MNEKGQKKAVITVLGKDKVGIIAAVSRTLAEHKVNILDISQTILDDFFTMIMIADISDSDVDFGSLKEILAKTGEEIGLEISAQNEEVFQKMHRI